jgi:rubrerythrin
VLGQAPEAADSKPSASQDVKILNFALLLEHVQAEFYEEALKRAGLKGELRQFAKVVGGHERQHFDFIKGALGGKADKLPGLDFGDDTADADKFAVSATKLEELAVAAYNAQAPNLRRDTLAAAARIVSVEARHSAWIRDIRGSVPAPFPTEPQQSAKRIVKTLNGSGYIE